MSKLYITNLEGTDFDRLPLECRDYCTHLLFFTSGNINNPNNEPGRFTQQVACHEVIDLEHYEGETEHEQLERHYKRIMEGNKLYNVDEDTKKKCVYYDNSNVLFPCLYLGEQGSSSHPQFNEYYKYAWNSIGQSH